MSSAVNKSQKRFVPKVSLRRPGGRAPMRRLSTLRASFSVPQAAPEGLGHNKATTNDSELSKKSTKSGPVGRSTGEKSSRAQMLGLSHADLANVAEAAVEEVTNMPAPKRSQTNEMHYSLDADVKSPQIEKRKVRGNAMEKNSPSNSSSPPILTNLINSNDKRENHVDILSSDGFDETLLEREPKPEAPDGFEYIWPEDLPQRRVDERRRKVAVERELVNIMKDLYVKRERSKIMEHSPHLSEDLALSMAQEAANTVTYHHLKQSVGMEAKQLRDIQINTPEDENSKTLLDVNKFTMASLCKDIPVGDRNDTYDDYELARVNRRRDTVRVFRAKMWSRRMYEPKVGERTALKEAFQKYQNERKDRTGKIKIEQQQKFTEIDDSNTDISKGRPQAAIEIQANGDISLVGTQFDRHQNNRSNREDSVGSKTEVDLTEQVINSYSYSTRERPDRWTAEETAKFYEAVSALGTDFNLISHLFPMRSRNQIKTKFKYEEKRNPTKLQIHMVSRRKFSVDSYSRVSNVPIQEVDSIEVELEKVRQEHAEQMKMEEESRKVAKAEDKKKQVVANKNPKREKN